MKLISRLFRPRTIWCPTALGWLLILVVLATPLVAWCAWGESFLCLTRREPADVLIVEGWISDEALEAAAAEFKSGNYHWVITTGGPNGKNWKQKRWTYAQIAYDRLALYGVPRNKILPAPAPEVEAQRTHESALAARQVLASAGLTPLSLNLFTQGAHARRSQIVFAKTFEPTIKTGVISWLPEKAHTSHWWKSTERSKDMLTETIGYLYEALFDSGRGKHAATAPKPSARGDLDAP